MAWFTTDWFSSHHTVRCAHKSGDVINFIVVACKFFSRLKWYKYYKNRVRLAKVIVKNKMSRFSWFSVYIFYNNQIDNICVRFGSRIDSNRFIPINIKFRCFYSDPVELTAVDRAWLIADIDSVFSLSFFCFMLLIFIPIPMPMKFANSPPMKIPTFLWDSWFKRQPQA